MLEEKNLECLARSTSGLWAKTILNKNGIELFWQGRIAYVDGKRVVLDSDGGIYDIDAMKNVDIDQWISAGVVPVDKDVVDFCGYKKMDLFLKSMLHHIVNMFVLGYASSPEELVGFFDPIHHCNFMNDSVYFIANPYGKFYGFDHVTCNTIFEEDKLLAKFKIGESENIIELSHSNDIVDFLISAIPI